MVRTGTRHPHANDVALGPLPIYIGVRFNTDIPDTILFIVLSRLRAYHSTLYIDRDTDNP